jgi:branched-chain amino acid aminotransferase
MSSSTFPPPPTSEIDWSNVGFKVREVNCHIECKYSVQTGKWTEPEAATDPFLRIHGMVSAVGLDYRLSGMLTPVGSWFELWYYSYLRKTILSTNLKPGQQCYEGQKAFRTPSGAITIFRPALNALRMQHSASVVSMPPVPEALFLRCVHLAVGLNAEYVPPSGSGASMYIRPLMFGSSAQLGLSPPEEYLFVVYVMPTGVYHGVHAVDALVLEDFDRSAPEGTGHAKIGEFIRPVSSSSNPY